MAYTLTDLFCGGGGSSTGATQIPGVVVRMAANHWRLAVDVHNENHPHADHDCADLSQVDPRRYPRTDMLWASPSCTQHSSARGKTADTTDPAAERSRATMWDVQRFTEHHRYRMVLVENVCEVRRWAGFRGWRLALQDTGYCLHEAFLNAAHANQLGASAAQWRDRWFCLAHPKGTRCPDTARWTAPKAWCPCCEKRVDTYQAWKRPDQQAGKYRAQYFYRCCTCRAVCEPHARAAAEVIDWSLPATRIGDRPRPLADRTMGRIRAGLERYGRTSLLVPAGGTWNDTSYPAAQPFRTRTTRESEGVLVPPPGPGLVVPYYSKGTAHDTREPLMTVTTRDRAALIPEPAPRVEDCSFRMLGPREYAAAQHFPTSYVWRGTKREQVRMAGNAVPPNMARDLVGCAVESMNG
ncbi:DNA cytosine methyltransferase [Streptomyces sp. 796.1]|uniref:DNA cytosine methyltransferase n=1 Tax=Streptomyces sp. 796.1 TaxID=3163029 RepID=UPI0039C97EA0